MNTWKISSIGENTDALVWMPCAQFFVIHTHAQCGMTKQILAESGFEPVKKVLLSIGTLVPSAIGALLSISHIEYLENK